MTEDEAKTKHCPFAKAFNGHEPPPQETRGGAQSPGYIYIPAIPHCIASACMAWRQDRVTLYWIKNGVETPTHLDPNLGTGKNDWKFDRVAWREGHCGLAGDASL